MGRDLRPDLAAELLTATVAAELLVVLLPGSIMRLAFHTALQGYSKWYNGHEEVNSVRVICNRTECTPTSMYLPSFLPSEPLLAGICADQLDHGHPTATEAL